MRKWFLLQADVRNNKGKDCGIRGGGQQGKRSLVQAEVWTNKEKENGISGGGGQQGKRAWFKEEIMSERSLARAEVGTNKRKECS